MAYERHAPLVRDDAMIVREFYGAPQETPSSELIYALCARSLSEGRRSTDREAAAYTMAMAGVDYLRQERFVEGRAFLSLSMDLYEAAASPWGIDRATAALAELEFAAGRPDVACELAQALTLRNSDPAFLANFAAYLVACQRLVEARGVARESVSEARKAARPFVALIAMQTFAATIMTLKPAEAAQLFGYVGTHLLASEYYYHDYTERFVRDLVKATLLDRLGAERFDAEMTVGKVMHEHDAYAIVLSDEDLPSRVRLLRAEETLRSRSDAELLASGALVPAEQGDTDRHAALALSALSAREWMIAKRVARGMSNAAIADELSLSRRTVETHVATILRKLNLRNRVLLASMMARLSTP